MINKIENIFLRGKNFKVLGLLIIVSLLSMGTVMGINANNAQEQYNNDPNVFDFKFKGEEEVFIVPESGLYTVEAWGAQGGNRGGTGIGGKGGYTTGEVFLEKNDEIYINVGGMGDHISRGFNGGGLSSHTGNSTYGGGASDIRVGGNSVFNRILVAAGGGASSTNRHGGFGGGVVGGNGSSANATYSGLGATQTSAPGSRAGGFGNGGRGYQSITSYNSGAAGGGGGWYGGGGGSDQSGNQYSSGGGGSSYVFTSTSDKPTNYRPDNKYWFSNIQILSGSQSFFSPEGVRITGRENDGYIRITKNELTPSNLTQLKDIKVNGVSIDNFSPEIYNYDLVITSTFIDQKEITVTKNHSGQNVDGDGLVSFSYGDTSRVIRVYSPDGLTFKDYVLNFNREKTSKLYSLDFSGFKFKDEIPFSNDRFEYNLDAFDYMPLEPNFITFDDTAIVTITGLDTINRGENRVNINVSVEGVEDTNYVINIHSQYSIDFTFKKKEQKFIVPYTGTYKVEAWGAEGGSRVDNVKGGLGGYASGEVTLTKGEEVSLFVGGRGNHLSVGYNGGGRSTHTGNATYGGGASDFRVGGNTVYNRILVAGGGGASSTNRRGGVGGGTNGGNGSSLNSSYSGLGAGQTSSPGSRTGGFGNGGIGYQSNTNYNSGAAGGGGGWFGGGGGTERSGNQFSSGGGGSGYVFTKTSSKPGSYNPDTKYFMRKANDGSIGNKDENNWKQSFIDINGKRVSGHEGDGHIRLTYFDESTNSSSSLQNIFINDIQIPNFDPKITDYTIEIEPDYQGTDEIIVEKSNSNQIVIGDGDLEFTTGNVKHSIVVISNDTSSTKTYTINFIRKNTSKLFDLKVDGFLFNDEVPFDSDTYDYEVDTFQDDKISISYETYNEASKVTVLGLDTLVQGSNTVQVIVDTPESESIIYTIKINRYSSIDYAFKNRMQVFIVPYTGKYKFETWGAQGGSRTETITGGLGGYYSGLVNLEAGEEVYLFVGGQGNHLSTGYNGGGISAHTGSATYGGGASDVRVGGIGLYNRILVAGGGGASSTNRKGGDGGGLNGMNGLSANASYAGLGATQSSSSGSRIGGFGTGGVGYINYRSYNSGACGGGAGWFGGGGGSEYNANLYSTGGGGSGYAYSSVSYKPANYSPDKKYFFSEISDGSIGDKDLNTWKQSFIDTDGTRVSGHSGDGHIRVTYFSDSVKSSTELNNIKINGIEIPNFESSIKEYTIQIEGEFAGEQEFEYVKKNNEQLIVTDSIIKLSHHNYSHKITVKSADKQHEDVYTVNFVRKPSTKLSSLSVDEYVYSFTENFKYDQYSYDLSSYVYGGVEVKFNTFDQDALVKITGADETELRPGNNKITVTVSRVGVQDTIYEINAYRQRDIEFAYSGKIEKFSAPYTGIYKFEAWGAQGGNRVEEQKGGRGGYTSGELYLKKGEVIYVTVGGEGNSTTRGYNGGGLSSHSGSATYGGGASDIRVGGTGIYNRVLVAGGGGAASTRYNGGHGGGLNGLDGSSISSTYLGFGATQTGSGGSRPGAFSTGGSGYTSNTSNYDSGGSGGGAGWFGGGGGTEQSGNQFSSGGGGSGYVFTTNSHKPTNYSPSTKYYMSNSVLIDGSKEMPGKDGFTVTGNEGNGFVRIALMNLYGTDSSLAYLNFSNGTPNRSFDADVLEYDVVLDSDQTELVISADTTDHNASVNWDSTKVLTIMPGVTRFELPVTAQDGSVRIYVVRVHRTASSYSYLADLSVDGVTIQDFEPSKLTYNLELTYDQVRKVEFDWMNARPDQLITGEKSVVLENGVPVTITVISEDGLHTSDYVITPIIEDSNLLKSLDIDEAKIEFDSNTFEYDVQVSSGISSLNIIAIPFDHEAVVTMSGNGYLRNGMNLVEITVTEPNTPVQVYTLNVNRSDTADGSVDTEYDFIYKGEVEYFEAPYTGNYKLETWGAEGGSRGSALGGKGGYSTGIVRLTQGEIVAVYVGGSGSNIQKGFNGGAISGTSNVYSGGASDVRVGEYGLYDRIIVAGGGGSVGASNKAGAAGGGLNGLNNTLRYGSGGQGGTQLEAGIRGSFGQGGNGVFTNGGRTGAGGGGWYGGGGSNPDYAADDDRGGGGGSAYLFTADSVKPTGYKVDSKYYLTDIETIAGNAQLPNKDGGYVVGNSGNGFVRITSLRRASTDNNLERIELDAGVTLEPEFDTEELNYTINLGVDQTDVTIKGVPMDPLATIIGNGNYDVPTPGIDVNLIVTSESGDIKTYSIRVNRSSSSNSLPQDVMISGLVPSLCDVSEDYCKENPEFTSADTIENAGGTYYLTVPSRIRSLEFNVIKGHEYQEVTGAGIVELDPGDDNIVYIEVASEDETSFSSYIFNITRDMTGNADLDTIDITYPERDLEFNPDVTEYYFSVPNDIDHTDKMDWTYATMDDQANAILEGEGDLSLGNNELKITVVASNGLTKVYKLFIYREDSSNTFLNRLIVTHDEKALLIAPSFNKVLHDYVLSVENEVSSVTIIAEAEEPDTTTVINGEDGVHELIVGQNNIEIKTTAQDGTSAVYSISIVRKPSSNAAIQSLTILGEEVDTFNPDLLLQTIVVDSQTTRPELEVVLDNEFASYTITGSYRVFGKGANTVHIRVTAEDGTIRNYTIIFDKVISDDSSLSSVSSNLFDIDTRFDPEVTEYDINIPYSETQMIMGGIPTHHTSKILGLGGYYLTSGMNSVKLEVVAEDNTSTTYTFNINMLKNTNPELKELTTNVGVFDPGFSSKVTEYAINVPNEASKITVSGVSFIASTVVEGLGEYVLNTGPNVIKVIAKAENGKTITYTLNITRDVSSNADLSYLIVHEGALSREFMPGIIEYDIAVPARTSRVTIEAAVQDPFATYTILNATNLKPGNNTVIVRVTPQDKIGVKDYTLNVYVQEEASENINLTNLRINPGKLNPDFLPARQFYRVSVGNDVTSINVEAIVGNNATLVGNGDYDLKVGNNLIVVKTKAANGVTKDYQIEVKRAPSTETRLKSFGVSGLNSSHTFRPDTYNYSGTTFRTSLGFNPIPMHENATVEVIGNHSFVTNSKTVIVIRVTAEDGITTKDYLFTVSKYASENNNLKTLSISGIHFTPEFTPGRTTYTAQADENTTQVVLTAVTEDVNAKIEMEKVHNLTFGENFIDITVVSEKGTRRKYTVVIDKAGSRVRDLKSLSVDGKSVSDFDKDTLEYDYEYLYETESIFVDYELADTKATISGVGEIPLTVGMNVLPVVVTSEHGDIKTYKLNVMRKAINSAEIETLKIDQYPIDNGFNPSIETYNLVIDNEFSALRFDIALKDKKAKFEITGNENLVVGNNIVRVKVTSSEGDKEKTYTFNVYKQEFGNNTLAYLDVDKESLKPSFFGGIMVYEVDLSYEFDEITFTGETDEKSASVANLGTKSLEYGVNHFKFPVRANNGVVRTYHVFVNRLRSNDNYINSMRVEAGGKVYDYTPEFDPKVNEYTLKEDVAPGTEAINLVLSSNVEGVSGTHRIPITVGTNKIEYVVTSDSGLKNTYIINLNRPASSNNSLTNIIPSAGGLAPNFIYSENEYKLNVDTTTTTLSFGVTTEDRNATVSGNDRKIVDVGESTRVITVTAENGEKKDYTITVVKSDTNNAYLDELSVVGYELKQNFDSHVFTYDLVVPNSKSIIHANEIIYKTSDSSAQKRVELTGSLNLLTGAVPNVFEVRVTAVDGFTSETYRINIIRESSSEAIIETLEFDKGTLNKRFSSYTYEYDLEFGSDATHFNKNMIKRLVLSDLSGVVSYSHEDDIKLEEGVVTPFTITVTSEDGTNVKNYVFNITYTRSRDNKLANIQIENAQFIPEFKPDILEYEVGVHEDITSVVMKAFPRDPKAKLLSVVGEQELINHTTLFEVKIQAENGDVVTYKLHIKRNLSNSLVLKDIGLTDAQGAKLTPNFDNFFSQYEAVVPKDLNHVGLIVVKGHESQELTLFDKFNNQVDINKFDLAIGRNDFKLEVRSPFGDLRTINFRIMRDGNSNNYLDSLNVTDPTTDIDFNKDKMEYFVEVPNSYDQIVLNYKQEDPTAKVTVHNNSYLKEGNNDVIVRVTAENGDTRNYVIHVFRAAKYNNFLNQITVSVGGNVISQDPKFFTPNFHRGTTNYVVKVGSTIDVVTVQGTPFSDDIIVTGQSDTKIAEADRGIEIKVNPGNNIVKLLSQEPTDGNVLIYTVNIIREMSDDVTLKSLELFADEILLDYEEGAFDSDRNFYTTSVAPEIDKLLVVASPQNPNARVSVTGHETLLNGENLIKVSVTSEDRTKTKVYTALVKKNLSGDNTLSGLNITDSDKPVTEFDMSDEEFTYTVGKDVDTVIVGGTLNDPMADINGLGTHSVIHGENKLNILVKAQNGEVKTYTVTVIREFDNSLESLRVNQGELSPEFDAEIFDYTVWVPLAVDRINIEGIAKNAPIAVVSGNGWYDLKVGSDNLFKVSVQSGPNDTAVETTIKVIRSASPNTDLAVLDIEQGLISPKFDSKINEYDTYIKDSNSSIDLIIVPEDSKATYEIVDNPNVVINATDKSKVKISQINDEMTTITIRVTAENGDSEDTILRVHRQPAALFSNLLSSLEVSPIKTMSPTFKSTTNNYIAIVDEAITFVTIKATKVSAESTIVSGVGTFPVQPGRNVFNIVVRSKDGVDNIYKVTINQVVSADASLSNLSFDEGFLTPIFSRPNKSYSINVGASTNFLSPHVTPYANETKWEITGPGVTEDLKMGENAPIEINTIAANGVATDKYTVKVNKTNQTSVYLKELTSNIGTFNKPFDKYQEGPYRLEIGADVNSIILDGKAEEPLSIKSITGMGVIDMSQSNNKTVEIVVTGNAGNKMTYYVEIVKALNDDVKLSYLAVNPGSLDPVFSSNQSLYNVNVEPNVDSIEILANTTGQAIVTGTGVKTLVSGKNTFTVTLTTDSGSIGVYTIIVDREAVQSAKILELRFNEALIENPIFDKDDTQYQLSIPYEVEALTINHILLEDPTNAEYEIIQEPSQFVVGLNDVKLKVTNKVSGDTMTYNFTVTRQQFSSNFLTSLSTDKGLLTPAFDKLHNYYDIDVPYDTTEIETIGTIEDGQASVSGIGPHRDLKVGVNEIKITVTSVTGVPRVYIVRVNRLLDSSNDLLTLNVEGGSLSPAFGNSEFNEYTVNVPEDNNKVTFTGTIPDTATASGLETITITSPQMSHQIVVTAQDGTTKTYKFTIKKQLSPDANVISITPSTGDLDPNFKQNVNTYDVIVDDEINKVGFDVVTSNNFAVVTGNEEKQLQYGDNIFTIKVVSENGLQSNEYTINVIRLKDIHSLEVSPENLVLNVNDKSQLELLITPIDASNTDVTWTSDNNDVVSVDENGLITANKVGNAVITVSSTKNPNIKATAVVEVLNLTIESDQLEIVRDAFVTSNVKDYVIGVEPNTTIDDYLDMFLNERSTLQVFDEEGTVITDLNTPVATKMTIRLIVNNDEYDVLTIIVRGDVNGDSQVDFNDQGILEDYIAFITTLDEIQEVSADVARDGVVDFEDQSKIYEFIVYLIDSLN